MTTLNSVARGRLVSSPTSTSSPRPILRKPTSVLGTRPREDDADAIPDTPQKKRKSVIIDETLNQSMDIAGSKSLEDAKREVKYALDCHALGDFEDYNEIVEFFVRDRKRYLPPMPGEHEDTLKPQELLSYIVALTSYATCLDKSCDTLIKAVLRCSWYGRDDVFARAYTQFLAALSSAHGTNLAQCIAMIFDNFHEDRPSKWHHHDFVKVDAETMKDRLHKALRYLMALFPAARSIVLKLMRDKFPYYTESRRKHMAYVSNLLRLREYSSDPQDIMELITAKVVDLDVQMQLDLEDTDDYVTAQVVRSLQTSDEWDETDDESVYSDDSDNDPETERILKMRGNVVKMDAILDALFGVYEPYFSDPESPEAVSCFQGILSDFINVVLPSYQSRHTQFLIFHFGQKSVHFSEMLVGTLFNVIMDTKTQVPIRQAAVAYLASFVARGALVPGEQVQIIARTLLDYMDYERFKHEPNCRGPDIRRYGNFYAYAQALLYVFCFRWRDLVNLDSLSPSIDRDDPSSYLGHELEWVEDLRRRMRANVYSKMNPLKVCAPLIASEFAKLSRHLNLMYVYPLLERNKTIHLSHAVQGTYSSGGAIRDPGHDPLDEKWTHLDGYFPFDPYQLPVSKRWLDEDNNYMPWRRIPGLNGDDEEDEDDDDGPEGERDEDEDSGDEELPDEELEDDTATDEE